VITLLIFYLHTVAAAAMFTFYWQEEGLKGGLASLGFMVLIFSVGWPMATIVLKLFMSPAGVSPWLDRDALSLVLLTAVEIAGWWYYLGRKGRKAVYPPGG
jgi:hypothetical protein